MTTHPPRSLWYSTADWFVEDALESATNFAHVFSMPDVRDDWVVRDPAHGYDAVFSRPADSFTAAPTRFEFIRARNDPSQALCAHSPYAPVSALQAPRLQQIHATVLAVDDIDNAVQWLDEQGVAARVEPPCEHLPFPRIWIGWDSDDHYVPGVEPSLFLEMIPAARISRKVLESVGAPSGRSGDSRIGWRLFLVEDLDEAVELMRSAAALVPSALGADDVLGVDKACFTFEHSLSAAIHIGVPRRDGPARDAMTSDGAGIWLTGLYVADPDVVIATAIERGASPAFSTSHWGDVLQHPTLPGLLVKIERFPS